MYPTARINYIIEATVVKYPMDSKELYFIIYDRIPYRR